MNSNQIEEKIIELALELYKDLNEVEKFKELVELLDSDPPKADHILFDFINKNKDYLIRETQVDLVPLLNQQK
jgi:hypothetical protein